MYHATLLHAALLGAYRARGDNVDEETVAVVNEHLPGTLAPGPGYHEGYLDGQAGRALYDSFGETGAENMLYEAGHECGAGLLAHGITIPWADRRVVPSELFEAVREVFGEPE